MLVFYRWSEESRNYSSNYWICSGLSCNDYNFIVRMALDLKRKYYRLLVRWPWLVIAFTIAGVAITWGVGLSAYPPSYLAKCFQDPTMGIEARGTEISGKSRAMRNLNWALGRKDLSYVPNISLIDVPEPQEQAADEEVADTGCAAEPINSTYGKFVFAGVRKQNLLNVADLKSICNIERDLLAGYFKYSCPAHFLPFYIASNQNITCGEITQRDIDAFVQLLRGCYTYYERDMLQSNCSVITCPRVPPRCLKNNVVYKSFRFLLDVDFRATLQDSEPDLKTTMLLLQDSYPEDTVRKFYETKVDGKEILSGDVVLPAMEIGYTLDLFLECIVTDIYLFAIALIIIGIIMYLYLGSGLLVFAAFMNVLFSFWVGYFAYHVIFRIAFFPFTNIMTLLLLIAIGADDIFIFADSWQEAKIRLDQNQDNSTAVAHAKAKIIPHEQQESSETSNSEQMAAKNITESDSTGTKSDATNESETTEDKMVHLVSETFHHALKSILITSLTTGAAMFSNFVSSITMIRCFGIFTMTCILVNFLLMVTWVPSLMVVKEKWNLNSCRSGSCSEWTGLKQAVSRYMRKFYEDLLPYFITKALYPLIVIFSFGGLAGIIVVFVTPKFQLPSTTYFPMFVGDHPFEVYQRDMKDRFEFSNRMLSSSEGMPLYFTWGVDPVDNGDWLDPFDFGHLSLKPFDSVSPQSQEWMVTFCNSLKNQSFIVDTMGEVSCTYEVHWQVLEGECFYPMFNASISPCCQTKTPVNTSLFSYCLPYCTIINGVQLGYTLGNHIFDKSNNISAFVLQISSSQPFSAVFSVMKEFYEVLDDFTKDALLTAPPGLEEGFFYSYFEFYDLQAYLVQGTYISMILSMAIALFFLLITTFNGWISVYSIIIIFLCISVVIALLVAQGWELNVVESAIVTLAVGLSIDFTIHYGVAFIQSEELTRKGKVKEALIRVGSSVSMAAITTFVAGLCLMPSSLIAYRQFGSFLMIVVLISWLYATFLLLPICQIIGPPICNSKSKEPPEQEVAEQEVPTQFYNAYDNCDLEFDLEQFPSEIPSKNNLGSKEKEDDKKEVAGSCMNEEDQEQDMENMDKTGESETGLCVDSYSYSTQL